MTHKVTKVQYAIKAIDKRNKTNIEKKPYFRREVEVMYKIHHPNVVNYMDILKIIIIAILLWNIYQKVISMA